MTPGTYTHTNATVGHDTGPATPLAYMTVVSPGTLGTTTVGPTHNTVISPGVSGITHNIVRMGIRANTWNDSAIKPAPPGILPAYSHTAVFSDTQGTLLSLLRWSTSEDPIMGGEDGRQTARSWSGSAPVTDGQTGITTVYWRQHRIPEWRERTITGISFQPYGTMHAGDQYDVDYFMMGKSLEPIANEVDTMLLLFIYYQSGAESYIDGVQVEEVAAGVTEPSDLWYPDGAHYWHPAPNNAIGKMYLESFSAGVSGAYQRGDNLVREG